MKGPPNLPMRAYSPFLVEVGVEFIAWRVMGTYDPKYNATYNLLRGTYGGVYVQL